MTGWLLDTNILFELRRPKPEPNVLAFISAQSLHRLYVSAVSFAEIRFGIEIVVHADRRAQLKDWLTHEVRPMFDGRTLAVSEDIMFRWRLFVQEGRKARHTFSQPDLIMAATALHHSLTIVTHNTRDFAQTRATVLNQWTDPLP